VQVEGMMEDEIEIGFEEEELIEMVDTLSTFEDEDYLLFRPEELPNKEYQVLFKNIYAYQAAIKILQYDV